MRFVRTLLVLVTIAVGGAAWAQAPGQTPPAGGGPGKNEKIERVKQKILALRAARLTDELGLDEKTAARLFPVLAKYDDVFAKLLRDNVQLRRQAQDAAARNDDRALDDVVDKLVANQRARWDAQEARFKDVRRVLTPAQAARMLVVLPQIDRQIQNQLRKALGRPANAGALRRRARAGGGDQDPDDDGDDPDNNPYP
jgi:hypothetical protein